jgi:hypothetical protein
MFRGARQLALQLLARTNAVGLGFNLGYKNLFYVSRR